MITLPPEFTSTRYIGYFWNIKEKRLYSIKVGGFLKPLKVSYPSPYNKINEPGYRVSVRGRRTYLFVSDLMRLKTVADEYIPVQRKLPL